MLILSLIGLIGGLITGISPCILPVLPVIFFAGGAVAGGGTANAGAANEDTASAATAGAGAASAAEANGAAQRKNGGGAVTLAVPETRRERRDRRVRRSRRPYAVIAGLVLSFSFFTLLGSALISLLDLPDSILHYAGLILLVAIGLGMIFSRLGDLLERPFARLSVRRENANSGGFVLGLGLGLVYVPCAGPVLTAIAVAGATHRLSLSVVVLTLSFAVGATLPLLAFALASRQVADRVKAFRTRAPLIRRISGVVMIVLAVALAFNLTDALQRALPGYTNSLQQKVESSSAVLPKLSALSDGSNSALSKCTDNSSVLQECGKAPAIADITKWLNTPGGSPVSLASLRGKVVLIDFWTYSCINCQRAIPHVEALSKTYQADGLQVIGVHTPEFVFERDPGNVAAATKSMGITYPVALDNGYATFDAYRNQYWPAQYLIDAQGNVRHISFGEGDYTQTEGLVRQLLAQANPAVKLPAATDVPNTTPTSASLTPETYLNYNTIQRYAGTPLTHDAAASYTPAATLPVNDVSLGGTWTAGDTFFTAGRSARLVLHFDAKDVYLVLAGTGSVTASADGGPPTVIHVSGTPNQHPVLTSTSQHSGTLTVTLSPGLQAYDLTFG
jgi:cytochrome c biogenesis protein CcdA/thiol-disulfide isomerase/thioredoxin